MFFLSFFGKAGDWLDAEFSKQIFLGVYDFVEGDRQTVVRRGAMSLDTDDLVAQQQIDRAAFNAGQAKFGLPEMAPEIGLETKALWPPVDQPMAADWLRCQMLADDEERLHALLVGDALQSLANGRVDGDAHVFQAPVEGAAMGCPKAGLSGYDSVYRNGQRPRKVPDALVKQQNLSSTRREHIGSEADARGASRCEAKHGDRRTGFGKAIVKCQQ